MASFEDHCFIDERHLGRRYPLVHRWLDEFFVKRGNAHRRERHHQEGVEEVRTKWGHDAARSAELHIIIDMGHVPTMADWDAGGIWRAGLNSAQLGVAARAGAAPQQRIAPRISTGS